ncbi:TetR/AcrR family transcriptional regulator C-terminal domain-containing protein [Raoultibacter phocaeensis]|uniref:TetR/AcrR family transcriptional regulator C-terminal domain-containing protein n=1 Tax=Raoultibacter phocaeensis TaxID=2479841 RepID=UPI001118ECDE|nr:TetR/AcrR family transcriptional regulator C-terminal domain-containing protein [Raoultibacter phocaeensis]
MQKQIETRLHFVQALSDLMLSCPLEKVKVSHLCDRMGVSRATFYEYFQDIFNVPTWFWDYLMSQSLYRMGIDQNCYDAHFKKFGLLLENKEFFVNAYKCIDYNSVCEHGGRTVKEHMLENARVNAGRSFGEQELLEIDFFVLGAQYMTRDWVRGGMMQPARTMTKLFIGFMPQFLIEALEPAKRL